MSKIKKIYGSVIQYVFMLVLVSAGSMNLLTSVTAQSNEQAGGSGLNISPTRTELRIEKGSSNTLNVIVKNISGTDIIAKAVIDDFESDNETGDPRYIIDAKEQLPTSLKPFISGVADIELKKDEQKTVEYQIRIPEDASAGAYYSAIRYTAIPKSITEQKNFQVTLTASVGSLVLIEVPGEITEKIQLRSVRGYSGDKGGSFFTKRPDKIGVEVKNVGNTFSKPFGTVEVTNIFGKKVHSYEINNVNPRSNVLPASTRIFKDEVKGLTSIGRYTITANVSYANGGEVLTSKSSFWIVPMWLLVLLAILLLAVLVGGNTLYSKRFGSKRK